METKPSYFSKLFSGRMNRQNYIFGSTLFVLLPTICFLVVIFNILLSPSIFAMPYLNPANPDQIMTPNISIMSLLETPVNELWALAGVIFIILSIPYLFSMQIRRQHDLNMNGWWWTVNILPFTEFYTYIPGSHATPGTNIWWMLSFLSLASSIFSLYFTIWPGTKGVNKYGIQPIAQTSLLKDILLLK
ncbi:MAG: DUF805 domain-containing protein [Candidatus Levyibacteriota bacterium]